MSIEEHFQTRGFCNTYSQASIFATMVKLIGNDIVILGMFLQISLPNFTHLLWHYIGSHILYHGFSPFRCNKRHLIESDSIKHHGTLVSLTSTLSNVFVHVFVHGRPIDPHSSNPFQGLFGREVHIADSSVSTFQVWNCCFFIYAQPHEWISILFPI